MKPADRAPLINQLIARVAHVTSDERAPFAYRRRTFDQDPARRNDALIDHSVDTVEVRLVRRCLLQRCPDGWSLELRGDAAKGAAFICIAV